MPEPDTLNRKLRHATTYSLLGIGLLGLLFGIAYLPAAASPDLPDGVKLLTYWIPVPVFGLLWIIASVATFIAAFRVKPYGSFGVIVMLTFWGVAHLFGWAWSLHQGTPTRGWLTGAIYLIAAAIFVLGAFVYDSALRLSSGARGDIQ